MLELTQNSAPQLPSVVQGTDYINSSSGEFKRSSAQALADAQNQLNMSRYNNDYSYWLWKQQTEYNDPLNQVARLKRAGLNMNYNSIEGAGNASQPPASQGRLNTNFLGAYQAAISEKEMKIQQANSIINGLNSLVRNIGEGFQMVDTYANLPESIPEYKSLVMQTLRNTVQLGEKNIEKTGKSIDKLTNDIAVGQQKLKMLEYQTGDSTDIIWSPYARNFIANTQKTLAQKGLINKQGYFTDQNAKKVASDIIVNSYKNALMSSQRRYYNAMTGFTNSRTATQNYHNAFILPLQGGSAARQFDILGAQLSRMLYDNSMMKFDKWFNYGTQLIGTVTGAARSMSPYLSGGSIPYYNPSISY